MPFHFAFPMTCVLTACGATCCYSLSWWFGSDALLERVAHKLVPGALDSIRKQVQAANDKGELMYYLLFARVFPFSPNWLLNMASPWLQVPLVSFFVSVLVGLMPYNCITVQAGSIFSRLGSTGDIFDAQIIAGLVFISGALLLPIGYRKYQQSHDHIN